MFSSWLSVYFDLCTNKKKSNLSSINLGTLMCQQNENKDFELSFMECLDINLQI